MCWHWQWNYNSLRITSTNGRSIVVDVVVFAFRSVRNVVYCVCVRYKPATTAFAAAILIRRAGEVNNLAARTMALGTSFISDEDCVTSGHTWRHYTSLRHHHASQTYWRRKHLDILLLYISHRLRRKCKVGVRVQATSLSPQLLISSQELWWWLVVAACTPPPHATTNIMQSLFLFALLKHPFLAATIKVGQSPDSISIA